MGCPRFTVVWDGGEQAGFSSHAQAKRWSDHKTLPGKMIVREPDGCC